SAIVTGMRRLNRRAMRPTSALMLLIILAGHYLLPLSSDAIRLFSVYHQPALPQEWSWPEFITTAVTWLLAGRLLEAVAGRRGVTLPVIAGALVLALMTRLVSPNLLFTWPMLAGALAGTVIWKLCEGRTLVVPFALL